MTPADPITIAAAIAAILDALKIRYVIGGWLPPFTVNLGQLSTSI